MKHLLSVKAVVLCAALSLPALAAAPAGPAAPAAKSARVIVKFKGDGMLMRESALSARAGELARVQHAERLSQRHGIAMRDGYPVAPRTQVVFAEGVSSAELLAKLRVDPEVEYAEIDERVRRADVPNDPRYAGGQTLITPAVGQWYLRPPDATLVSAINAQQAWDVTTGSQSVVVAVIDTGVRPDHPDLALKLLPGYDFVSQDSANVFVTANDGDGRDTDPSDPGDWVTQQEVDTIFANEGCIADASSWHGTQTAALVGAATNNSVGMASVGRDVSVLPVRVLGKCGGFTSDVVAGMYWAAGLALPSGLGTAPINLNPAKVLNLSLGSTGSCTQLYQDAVTAITNAGASVVVSAGNDVGLAVGKPANCAGAIGVGGLRHIGTKVGFSDVGPEIAISAPGGNCVLEGNNDPCLYPILTATNSGATVPATNTYSDSFNISVGTSFSAPLASGVAALMLSRNPALTPAQVRSTMMATARPFPSRPLGSTVPACHAPNGTEQEECYCTTATCGAGMLDAAAAVGSALTPISPDGGSSGGGGSLSWPWLLALLFAVALLRPRRQL